MVGGGTADKAKLPRALGGGGGQCRHHAKRGNVTIQVGDKCEIMRT